jgi:ABC-type transport system substrate-binding protein
MNGYQQQCPRLLSTALCLAIVIFSGCSKEDSDQSEEIVLRYRMLTKVQTLDPGNSRDIYSGLVLGHICEALYTYGYLERPYTAVPVLAADMPQLSDDYLTCTIQIKPGVYYQDDPCFEDGKGREVKADDFVYAFKRIANIRYASQNWSTLNNKIVGLDEFREYTKQFRKELDVDYSRVVEGLQALDDYTLQFKLVKPWPQMVDTLLTDNMSAPVPHEAVAYYGEDIISHPVGTGAYQLKRWQRGVYIELVRNPNWRQERYPSQGSPEDVQAGLLADAGKPLPFADRIIWRVIEEDQPAWLLLMRGEIDGMGIPKDNFNEAVGFRGVEETDQMKERGIELIRYNDPSVFWIGFNFNDPVLGKNLPLRKAISRGFNREQYNEILFNGRNIVAQGFIPPGLNSYDPEIEKYGFSKYDPTEAKELLKEAERIHGGPIPKLSLAMPGTDTFSRQQGLFTQRQFARLGLQLEVSYMDWPTYMEGVNNGKYQMFASGIGAGSPDALDFLDSFTTKSFAPGPNKFFYSNPEYDALFAEAEVLPFDDEVKEIYRQLERMALESYPGVFTAHRMSYVLKHQWLQNYKVHIFAHGAFGKSRYYKIDLEARNTYKERLKQLKEKNPNE